MTKTRTETDSMGAIEVPAACYWGAQTQRSLGNFKIGAERMPLALIHAFGDEFFDFRFYVAYCGHKFLSAKVGEIRGNRTL